MKTIKQAARDFALIDLNIDALTVGKIEGFKAGVEFAQRWIPVEEELPEENIFVLCINPFSAFVACFKGKDKGFRIPNVDEEYKITHWRPIEYK